MATNYIHYLQGIRRDAHFLAQQAQAELDALAAYLLSSKFHSDTTVQIQDVLARLNPARSTLVDLCHITQAPKAKPIPVPEHLRCRLEDM